ncbi:hypothetical protein OS242_09635 [Tumebacillus sp. DT12]|uniref:Uncharacterized protein n=1 Tax=Tumebacillus lacus TaxID=2995335 RepID=A0ABT3X2N4_9BACL|nr:hypothetical protein [Tumebacillus lacus]MCX7570222.1 hypothetical protein [Tumebacillus lacus]
MHLRMDSTAENCMVKTLDAVFSYYKEAQIPEHALVAAGDGLLLAYGENRKEDGKGARPHLAGFAGEGFLQRASARLGLDLEVAAAPVDAAEAKSRILEWLGKGELCALVLDEEEMTASVREELTRSRAKVDLASNFHIVIPVAFDPATDQVELWMAGVPDTVRFPVSLTDLASTWCHTARLFPEATVVWWGAQPGEIDRAGLCRRALDTVADGLLGQGDLTARCFTWLHPQSFGVQALLDMADELPRWPERVQPYERCKQLFLDMLTIKADAGYVFDQLAHLLDEAALVLEVPVYAELAVQAREIKQEWEILSNLFFKAGFSKAAPAELLTRMADRLRKIAGAVAGIAQGIRTAA